MTTILEQYSAPPLNHETTKATHFIHFPWSEHWDEDRWQAVPELSRREQGDIVTSKCAEVFNTLPNLENSRVIATLSHKARRPLSLCKGCSNEPICKRTRRIYSLRLVDKATWNRAVTSSDI